ncbi:hypothetical protein GCM10012285_33530 [Streptomyces kronopolitis]|uniref:Uncharacterized protein n=1 Tax=Streptomyces kronopolitis TaxID=1612435 RepID=A0ABQ2JJI7_9ACTN|nr:hypothetical protein GCM10012285_33530 [Streptomyces kronopolitis]
MRGRYLGWEKCYVLGKESARPRRHIVFRIPAITPERQPLATLSRNLLDRLRRMSGDPPVHGRRTPPPTTRWGPKYPATPTGCRAAGMDRAWPIVVHSRPPHKGLVTCG